MHIFADSGQWDVFRTEKLVSDCDKSQLVVTNLEFGVKCLQRAFQSNKHDLLEKAVMKRTQSSKSGE